MKKVEIWTDGSCPNNGKENATGGAAAIIKSESGNINTISYKEENSTNQRMEIKAVTIALKLLYQNGISDYTNFIVYSDSAYVVNCFNQKWYLNWERNSWKNSKKEPVANQDLWKELLDYYYKIIGHYPSTKIDFIKVKGHSGVPENEEVDRLAVMAATT